MTFATSILTRKTGLFSGCILLAAAAQARGFYVDQSFQGENSTGESWVTAYPSLQDAIDQASESPAFTAPKEKAGRHPSA
jgi:hypothetical protein